VNICNQEVIIAYKGPILVSLQTVLLHILPACVKIDFSLYCLEELATVPILC